MPRSARAGASSRRPTSNVLADVYAGGAWQFAQPSRWNTAPPRRTAASSTSGVYDTFFLFNYPIIYDLGTGTFGNVNANKVGTLKVIWGAGDSSQQFTLNGDGNGNNTGSLLLNNLNLSDVSFYRSGSTFTDLTIANKATGATLTFHGEFANPWNGVASVTFANGTVWQGSAIAANTYITPASSTTGVYDTSNLTGTIIYFKRIDARRPPP